MTPEISALLRAMGEPRGREAAARALASELSCDYLLVFLRDTEINALLPAPGFPKTFPAGRQWRDFLELCEERGRQVDVLPFPSVQHLIPARGLRGDDGSVFVFLGGQPREKELEEICKYLTLLNVVYLGEQRSGRAVAMMARSSQTAKQARELTEKLHESRRELRESFEKLRESESLLRTVTNEARVGLIVVNQERRYAFANATYAEIFGLPGSDLVDQKVADVIGSAYAQMSRRLDQAFRGERVTDEPEVPGRNEGEAPRFYEAIYEPRLGSAKPYVVVVFVDITQRKEAEQRLIESEQKLQVLVDGIPNLAWMANPDGWIFWYNQRWYEYTGTTQAEMEGWGWQSVHDRLHLPAVLERWRGCIASGQPFEMVFPLRGVDGRFRKFLTRVVPLRDAEARIQFWFGTNTDVTLQLETEEALIQAQKKLRDYAMKLEERVSERTAQLEESLKTMESYNYSIAHDLRSPLRGMMGFADLLLEAYAPLLDNTGQDYVRRIKTGASRMDELVRDLLEFGRLAHLDLPLQTLDLGEAVAKAIDHLSTEIQARRAVMDLQAPWPPVRANPSVLNQILVNLIGNAMKFVNKDTTPRVTVHAEKKRKGVRVWVEDNGLGIEAAYQKRIFNMFERLHTHHSHPGTGIGLAIVKKGIERMGGTCGVESKPGKGSRFWIELTNKG